MKTLALLFTLLPAVFLPLQVSAEAPLATAPSALASTTASTTASTIPSTTGETMTYWIDTRTQEEHDAGHIEGSAHIPFEVIAARITEITDDKNADIRVYCRSGRRSGVAKDTLTAMGYTNVVNEGGYEEIIQR